MWRVRMQAREDYEQLMKQNRNSTISGQDIYITHRCQVPLPHRIPRVTSVALAKDLAQCVRVLHIKPFFPPSSDTQHIQCKC